jgi:hypothetical protein
MNDKINIYQNPGGMDMKFTVVGKLENEDGQGYEIVRITYDNGKITSDNKWVEKEVHKTTEEVRNKEYVIQRGPFSCGHEDIDTPRGAWYAMTELLDEVIDEEGDIPDFLPPKLNI